MMKTSRRPRFHTFFFFQQPGGLARFSSSESWISQWSLSDSQVDGVESFRFITQQPCLFIENGKDNGVPVSHLRDMFEACAAKDKSYVKIQGATHYYTNQKKHLARAVATVVEFLNARKLISVGQDTASRNMTAKLIIEKYRGGKAPDILGINHLALVCSDMERTCEFYCNVLGFRLSKTIRLPTGAQHFFLDIGSSEKSSLAFFWFPNAPPPNPSISAPSLHELLEKGEHPSAHGSMNHVAFNIKDESLLAVFAERLQKSPLCSFCSPIVYHADNQAGFAFDRSDPCVTFASIYFFGPDGELLELTSQIVSLEKGTESSNIIDAPKRALWRQTGRNVSKL